MTRSAQSSLAQLRRRLLLVSLLGACSVPDLSIVDVVEVGEDAASSDAGEGDASAGDSGSAAADGGGQRGVRSAERRVNRPRVDGGTRSASESVESGEDAGEVQEAPSTPTDEPNPCIVWVSASASDDPPLNAVEGGLETTVTVPSRQYVCRTRPPGSDYAVPGKAIFGRGCLVAYRRDGGQVTYIVPDAEPFEVLTPGAGCSFSWQSATSTSLPSRALDLGEPHGGGNYACHGYYVGALSSGVQIGAVSGANDAPPRYECWFESYLSALQPQDPTRFEVLAQDL